LALIFLFIRAHPCQSVALRNMIKRITIAHKPQFQVLVISHHNVELFRHHADRIYRITPAPKGEDGVNLQTSPAQEL